MFRALFLLVCCFGAALSLSAQPLENLPDDPRIVRGKLANGLSYYVVQNAVSAGRADFYLVEKSGSVLEEAGQAGMSAFLANMCLRGTRNFPGTSMFDYLTELGLRLDRDFEVTPGLEETMFRLSNIPVRQSPGVLDSTLLILYNWSCCVNLDEEDVESVRTFFRNNLARKDSAQYRMERRIQARLLEGTRYPAVFSADMLEQMQYFTAKELRRFYYRWSRPDLQAVIVVGDVDAASVETQIKTLFQTTPKAPSMDERVYDVPALPSGAQLVLETDPEAVAAKVTFHFRSLPLPLSLRKTAIPYLQEYLNTLVKHMLQDRLDRSAPLSGLPVYGSGLYQGRFMGEVMSQEELAVSVRTFPDSAAAALRWLGGELEQVRRNGFDQASFDRSRQLFFNRLDYRYDWRNLTPNRDFADRCIAHFLEGMPLGSIELYHAYLHQADSVTDLRTVNTYAAALLQSPDRLAVTLTGPERMNRMFFSEEELLRELEESGRQKPAVLPDIPAIPEPEGLQPGTIVSEVQEPITGARLLTLSNGANVVIRPSRNEVRRFRFEAVSKGGLSLMDNSQPMTRRFINEIAALSRLGELSATDQTILLRSRGLELEKQISLSLNTLAGNGPVAELEDFLRMVHLHFTAIGADEEAFSYFKEVKAAEDFYAEQNPEIWLADSLYARMYRRSRFTSLGNVRMIDDINYPATVDFLRRSFSNAASYTFMLAGDFEMDRLRELVCRYIGSLPGNPNRRDNWKTVPYYLDKVDKQVVIERSLARPKAYYRTVLIGEVPFNLEDMVMGQLVAETLRKTLFRTMLEAGVYPEISREFRKYPEEFLILQMSYVTDSYEEVYPERMREVLDRLVREGVSEEEAQALKRGLERNFRLRQEADNGFWIEVMRNRFIYGKDFYTRYRSCLEQVTAVSLNRALREFLTDGNRVELVLRDTETKTKTIEEL